jgi:cyclophilin family peptidyl-prolyl cis-trans isomerase
MNEDFSLQTVIMMPVGLLVLGVILLFTMSPAEGDVEERPGPVAQGSGTTMPPSQPGGAAGSGTSGDTSADTGPGKLVAKFETFKGNFEVDLYPRKVPNIVRNFVYLATEGFYNDQTFHLIIPDYLIQGGSPTGDETGGPGYWVESELADDLKHDGPGVLSMATAEGYCGSQFFITLAPAPELDGSQTVFGKVSKGMNVVEKIGKVSADEYGVPQEEVKIRRLIILKDGRMLREGQPEPEKIE